MSKSKSKLTSSNPVWLPFVILAGLGLLITILLRGTDVALLHPKGLIATEEYRLMLRTVLILLEIAVPALFLFFFFAWKYRESNQKAVHDPQPHHDKSLVFTIWALPSITMLLLVSIMWPAAHQLAPQKAIASAVKPLTIQVIALRWKWLFIYPEQNIATVNFIQVPVGTPLQFDLTADETPMSSFWIPHLGGQLYAMTGHVNRLNLEADSLGDYTGRSTEINGAGFAGMQFTTRASSGQDFDQWVQSVKQSSATLDAAAYEKLLTPSESNPAAVFATAESNLYANTVVKYSGSHGLHTEHE